MVDLEQRLALLGAEVVLIKAYVVVDKLDAGENVVACNAVAAMAPEYASVLLCIVKIRFHKSVNTKIVYCLAQGVLIDGGFHENIHPARAGACLCPHAVDGVESVFNARFAGRAHHAVNGEGRSVGIVRLVFIRDLYLFGRVSARSAAAGGELFA